jgi:hypothetical protein
MLGASGASRGEIIPDAGGENTANLRAHETSSVASAMTVSAFLETDVYTVKSDLLVHT